MNLTTILNLLPVLLPLFEDCGRRRRRAALRAMKDDRKAAKLLHGAIKQAKIEREVSGLMGGTQDLDILQGFLETFINDQ